MSDCCCDMHKHDEECPCEERIHVLENWQNVASRFERLLDDARERIRELEEAERICKAANESQRKTIVALEAEASQLRLELKGYMEQIVPHLRIEVERRDKWIDAVCEGFGITSPFRGGGRESGPGERTGTAYVTPERTRAAADPAARKEGKA